MSSPTVNPVAWHEASAYATAVRRQLDDLPPDVVEELTGGLEADLLDQASESTDPLAGRLGDPAGYAAELRAAAGVAPRTAPPRSPGVLANLHQQIDRDLDGLRRQSWWPEASAIALQLRPVWWVVRAWVAFQLVDQLSAGRGGAVPSSFGEWVLLLAFVAGSVALGRGLWARWSGRRPLLLLGNALAVLFLLPALVWVDDEPYVDYGSAVPEQGSGLVLDGETVTNVFPYGPDGEPLEGVTLLDQDGDPLAVGSEALPGGDEYDASGRIRVQVPNWTEDGDQAWNVYPMGTALVDAEDFYADWYSGADTPGSALRPPYRSYDEPTAPRLRVPAVLVDPSRSLRSTPSPRASDTATTPAPSTPSVTAPTTPGAVVTPPAPTAPTAPSTTP